MKRAQPFLPKPHKVPLNHCCRGLLSPTNKHDGPPHPKSQSPFTISTRHFLYIHSSFYWRCHTSVCTPRWVYTHMCARKIIWEASWEHLKVGRRVTTYHTASKPLPQNNVRFKQSEGWPRVHTHTWTHPCSHAPRTSGTLWEPQGCEMPQTTALY